MLLTTKFVDGIPLHRFERVMQRHGLKIPRQTLARWVIESSRQLQPLYNLMQDQLLQSPYIHCDETRVQVLKEPDRSPESQSWMWVMRSGRPERPILLYEYSSTRNQGVPLRLLVEEETNPSRFSIHQLAHYCLELSEMYGAGR